MEGGVTTVILFWVQVRSTKKQRRHTSLVSVLRCHMQRRISCVISRVDIRAEMIQLFYELVIVKRCGEMNGRVPVEDVTPVIRVGSELTKYPDGV